MQIDHSGIIKGAEHAAGYAEDLRIVAIDNDHISLKQIGDLITQMDGVKYQRGFLDVLDGIAYIKEQRVDLVFIAISMYSDQGIIVARQLEEMNPPPAIAFVTWRRDYSYDAWRTNAVDYILKPVKIEDLVRTVGRARYYKLFKEIEERKNVSKKQIVMKCFPSFDVFVDGEIVEFTYAKVKELLAFLVYQQGNWCTIDQIVFSVLEKQTEKSGKQYYRTLMHRLKNVLERYGIQFILETGYGRARIKSLHFTCEYYEYLKGKRDLFQGTFMGTYLWAEDANAFMTRESNRVVE